MTDTVATATVGKRTITISPEAKRASALRRDASMLERLATGSSDPTAMLAQAAALKAQADQLAPSSVGKNVPATLTEAEWNVIEGYFLSDIRAHLREGFSVKKLKAIASGTPSA